MRNFLASRRAFYIILAVFCLESLVIALTARYPMAFDEYAHFGIAQLYTHSWSPFLRQVPASAALYGPVTADPSFLYRYLLSFPLRILQGLSLSLTWQIILLRILNIGLAAASLVVYRRLLRRLGVSALQANIVLLFFILIPVVPLIAGQITYDNLFFLFVAIDLLVAVEFVQHLQAKKSLDLNRLHWMVLVGLFTCLIKYPYIPAYFGLLLVTGVMLLRNRRLVIPAYKAWWRSSSRLQRSLTILFLAIGLTFFAGSYGANIIRYHNPLPDCDVVLNEDACKAYGPWYRDYIAKQAGGHAGFDRVPWYTQRWVRQMMQETFFMVGAQFDEHGTVFYYSKPPITGIYIGGWALLVIGSVIFVYRLRYIWRRADARLLIVTIGLYTVALFGLNLQFFLETGAPVAIHGRYVLPFILPIVGLVIVALRQTQWRTLPIAMKTSVVGVCLVLFLQGGGVISYLVLTDNGWMWPQSRLAQSSTDQARRLLSPLIYRR